MYPLPNVLNKLEDINNMKQDISNALVNQGQNMTNVLFRDYPDRVDDLKCSLTYFRFKNIDFPTLHSIEKATSIFNFSLFTSTSLMFAGCNVPETIPNFDTSNVEDMSYMFQNCKSIKYVPDFDTSNVKYMDGMFSNCSNLVNVPNFNIGKLSEMSHMFADCTNLVNIPDFDTSNIINISSMFFNCTSLIDIPRFNYSVISFADYAFANCKKLTEISNLELNMAYEVSGMFSNCINLVNVTNLSIGKYTDRYDAIYAGQIFRGCTNLVNVINLDIKPYSGYGMFSECYSLANISEFDTSNMQDMSGMFSFCNNLSSDSIQNIINMCLNATNVFPYAKTLMIMDSASPLYQTIFDPSYYDNRLAELTDAGWRY